MPKKFLGGVTLPQGAGAGLVLTSDASGNGTWQTAPGGSGYPWTTLYQAKWTWAASAVAGTYIGRIDAGSAILSSANQTSGSGHFRLDPTTDYAVSGKTTQIRFVHSLWVAASMTNTLTFGLYPVSSHTTLAWTLGTVVASTTAAFTNPNASAALTTVTSAITMPAAGDYTVGCVTTAAMGSTGTSVPFAQSLVQIRIA